MKGRAPAPWHDRTPTLSRPYPYIPALAQKEQAARLLMLLEVQWCIREDAYTPTPLEVTAWMWVWYRQWINEHGIRPSDLYTWAVEIIEGERRAVVSRHGIGRL